VSSRPVGVSGCDASVATCVPVVHARWVSRRRHGGGCAPLTLRRTKPRHLRCAQGLAFGQPDGRAAAGPVRAECPRRSAGPCSRTLSGTDRRPQRRTNESPSGAALVSQGGCRWALGWTGGRRWPRPRRQPAARATTQPSRSSRVAGRPHAAPAQRPFVKTPISMTRTVRRAWHPAAETLQQDTLGAWQTRTRRAPAPRGDAAFGRMCHPAGATPTGMGRSNGCSLVSRENVEDGR
jgi:hypothetical protein